jgi:7,8-dihydro-6-hydroxymethylpterin dimethyltransferase
MSTASTLYLTTSLCPTCERLLPARVVARDDGVFVTRECPEHGTIEGLVCSDLDWWRALPRFDVEPVRPASPGRPVDRGCPLDCGLCSAHRQIAGTAAIEISNRCNAACPTCIADNQASFELTPAEVGAMIDRLLAAQGKVDVLAISGGEPTIHPRLFEILDATQRPEIGRVALNSNGILIARDDALLDGLARYPNLYVTLHFDGPTGARALRAADHAMQRRALERLGARGIAAVPVVLAAQGVNEPDLGDIVAGLLRSDAVRSVMVSMVARAGARGATFGGDPRRQLTIPAALDWIERRSGGALARRDFMPLPMSNPMCAAIGYFLVEGGDITGLIPLGELDDVIESTKNTNFMEQDADLERLLRDAIDRLYADPARAVDAPRALAKFRALVDRLFPPGGALDRERRRVLVERHIKTVYLFQFMDAWTFDTKRLKKCSCQHLMPTGETIPSCGYYALHRRRDPRFSKAAP